MRKDVSKFWNDVIDQNEFSADALDLYATRRYGLDRNGRCGYNSQEQLYVVTLAFGLRVQPPNNATFKVNSPGPAAGAYWLERRQSYRVKMAAPPAPSGNNDGGGRKQHLHVHHQQQRPRPSPSSYASVSVSFEADDRAGQDTRTSVKGNSTPNKTVRPVTTIRASRKKRGNGGEKRRK